MAQISNKLEDIYTSTKADTSRVASNIQEKIVCLVISNFIVSLLLSFTIALYNFMPLTANANIHGIKIIFCSKIDVVTNKIPFSYS